MFFRRKRTQEDFHAELDAHLQIEADRLEADGLPADEARAAARRRFGNVTRAEERFRESHRWLWWDHFRQDVRYALRMLRGSPGFALVAILTMAVGIGATTAIFSVVDATLLHPLPFPHPEQLVKIEADLPGVGAQNVGISQPEWQDLQHAGIFDDVSPIWYDDNNLVGSSRPLRVSLLICAPNYFALLGAGPALGRAFPPSDYTPGFTGEVVISDELWKRAFGGDPSILGRSMRMDTDLYRIVGVMPPGFHAPGTSTRERNIEVWAATSFFGAPLLDQPPRNRRNLPTAVARIAPGLTVAAAQSRVDALVATLQSKFPADYPAQSAWRIRLVPLQDSVVGDVRRTLVLMLGAVGLVLLIGCVNVANLLLARAGARAREMAIRQALGGGRTRLIRQLLTESALLSFLGGAAGLGVLFAARRFLLRLIPDSLPRLNDIAIGWSVLLFALAASILTGVVFGLVPALHVDRVDVNRRLRQNARGAAGSRERSRTGRLLVIAEFALALVLMVAAGLLLRSFQDLLDAPLGFNPDRLMAVRTRLPYPNVVENDLYRTVALKATFTKEVLRRVRSLPGVDDAAISDFGAMPLEHDRNNQNPPRPLILQGRATPGADVPLVDSAIVTPEYFHVTGMTLLRGREFDQFDAGEAAPVAVINESMAKKYWPGGQPLGSTLKLSPRDTAWTTVVGVVGDARTESMADGSVPEIYVSQYQTPERHLVIFLRGQLDAATMEERVRAEVQAIDPTLPVFGAETLNDTVATSLTDRRFGMEMIGLFALTALLLAGLGIYGVTSYSVSARTREIGIRLALGAPKGTVLQMILRQGLALTLVGAAVGFVFALFVSRLMTGVLYGVRPTDPLTFAGVAALLVAVASLACFVPARRAIRTDPMIALRHE
jgi:predicted permease